MTILLIVCYVLLKVNQLVHAGKVEHCNGALAASEVLLRERRELLLSSSVPYLQPYQHVVQTKRDRLEICSNRGQRILTVLVVYKAIDN